MKQTSHDNGFTLIQTNIHWVGFLLYLEFHYKALH